MQKLPTVVARMWGREPVSRRGPRPGLTLDRIADAAIEIADAEGLAGVRMSSVAARLGVSTMSLYGYVASKDELLTAMVDAAAPKSPEPGTLPWREYLSVWTRANRDFLVSHLWLLEVSPLTPPTGPRTLRWLDRALTVLGSAGLTAAEAVNITSTLSAYAASSATLLSAMSGTVDETGPEGLARRRRSLPRDRPPHRRRTSDRHLHLRHRTRRPRTPHLKLPGPRGPHRRCCGPIPPGLTQGP
ncbi:TetR/AcrR family transcriptional regulator [Nonomuraea sp. NPDC049400]|uniref:TetR/AcrR family transcriptional regulator n=1 Tax=Nonomuraea sp. NPDC049400 TaxID=3364352 RepID=UPI0037B1E6BC